MAKSQPEVKEVKIERSEEGQIILVTVYKEVVTKKKRAVKLRGRQTSDAQLLGGWGHNSLSSKPKC